MTPHHPPRSGRRIRDWDRRSVAQFGLAHWLHARGTSILANQLPAVHRDLVDHGGFRFNFAKYLLSLMPGAEIVDDDDRFDLVTGRRSTHRMGDGERRCDAPERHRASG